MNVNMLLNELKGLFLTFRLHCSFRAHGTCDVPTMRALNSSIINLHIIFIAAQVFLLQTCVSHMRFYKLSLSLYLITFGSLLAVVIKWILDYIGWSDGNPGKNHYLMFFCYSHAMQGHKLYPLIHFSSLASQ